MLESSRIIQIANNNPNLLPAIVVILAIIYIIYALISIGYNKKHLKKLQHIKHQIKTRHDSIVNENENIKRFG